MSVVEKSEFVDSLSKKRGLYRSGLVNTLWEDFKLFGWIMFDESRLRKRLDDLIQNIKNDISSSPEIWVERLIKEIFEA